MPKDNREILYAIRTNVDEQNPRGRVFKSEDDFDAISSTFTQSELDGFVERGVLSGDWKSTAKKAETAEETTKKKVVYVESELLKLRDTKGEGKARLVEIARALGVKAIPDSMSNRVIINKILEAQK